MRDPQEIWQLGQWIGRRENGAVRLGWSDGELILRLQGGRIRFVEGVDTAELANRLSCVATGSIDLLEEARALARSGQISETSAMGAAKELLQDRLRMWMRDPGREIETVDGVKLLDVDPGGATNRTVVTFVGEPDAVIESAVRAAAKATELIDMSQHTGEHPRFGAMDVCPFVPVAHITMQDQAAGSDLFWRKLFGGKVAQTAEHPETILYAYATQPRRLSPQWYHEGGAVFFETWMAGGYGRAQGYWDEMVFRAMVRDDAHFYDPLGLVAAGTKVDFQVGVARVLNAKDVRHVRPLGRSRHGPP